MNERRQKEDTRVHSTNTAGNKGPPRNNGGRQQQQHPANGAKPPVSAEDSKRKRADKKMGKREKQLVSMKKKADEEDKYFRQCQREASQESNKRVKTSPATDKARELELFGTQGAQGIDFAKYDDIKVEVKNGAGEKVAGTGFTDFDQLGLDPIIRRNVELMRYATPTPIQRHSVPIGLDGNDLMCCAQTGSGKTCAFLLPVCAALAKSKPQNGNGEKQGASPRCVVLAPTRELAIQIEIEAQKLCHQIPSVQPVAIYGGVNQRKQIRNLAFGSDIVVATPGRLTDFVDRSIIKLDKVEFLILDEADRMLDMGFEPQIRKLVLKSGMTPKEKRQTFMFSATFPAKIQLLASQFLRAYTWIAVGRVGSTTDSITQVLVKATPEKREKLQLVVEAILKGPSGRTLVFVQKKRTATWLKTQLNQGGPNDGSENEKFRPIRAEDIHGDRSQSQRETALAKFRAGTCRVLVATDVAARGLDISGVEHVINMDLPTDVDDFDSYVHRIGRTGRAGHTGLATSFYIPGLIPKVGNGKIATQLVDQLKDSKQEVPSWLKEECAGRRGGGRPASGGRGAIGTDARRSGGGGRGGGEGGRGGGREGRGSGRGRGRGGGRGASGRGRGGRS
jgi:ATP-dependent RNA helicase DDX3X